MKLHLTSRHFAWIALLTTLTAIALVLILANWQRVSRGKAFSGEAASNPFFALETYLDHWNIDFELVDFSENAFPEEMKVLVYPSDFRVFEDEHATRLMNWIDSGGTLLYIPDRHFDSLGKRLNDPITARMGVRLEEYGRRNIGREIRSYLRGCSLTTTEVPGSAYGNDEALYPLITDLHPDRFFRINAEPDRSVALYSQPQGSGRITLLTSWHQWTNRFILCYDNAYLFLRQLPVHYFRNSGNEPDTSITPNPLIGWIEPGENTEHLFERLWHLYFVSISFIGCVFVLWLWKKMKREVRPDFDRERLPNSVLHYVGSVASLLWSRKEIEPLLAPLQAQISELYKHQDPSDIAKHAERHFGLDAVHVRTALEARGPLSRSQLVRRVSMLQKLKSLR